MDLYHIFKIKNKLKRFLSFIKCINNSGWSIFLKIQILQVLTFVTIKCNEDQSMYNIPEHLYLLKQLYC